MPKTQNILFLGRDWKGKQNGPTYWREGIVPAIKKDINVKVWIVPSNIFKGIKLLIKNWKEFKEATIIQTQISDFSIITICLIGKLFGKKHFHMLHGNHINERKDKGLKMYLKYEIIIKIANVVSFPTQYLRKTMLKQRKFRKTFVIHPGIKLTKLKKAKFSLKKPKTFIDITSFHRYDKGRGVVPLTEAFNEIKEKGDKLLIVGGGVNFDEFKKKCSGKDVIFMGHQKDAHKLLRTADVFVHSSFMESFGIVILEAMVERLPILTVNVEGIPEATGKAGLIVEPTKEGLVKGLLEMKNNFKLRKKMVEEQEKHLPNYSWNKIAAKLIKEYESN